MTYDWMATLALIGTVALLTLVGKLIAFRVPALERMRIENREVDKKKLTRLSFRQAIDTSRRAGLGTNLFFFLAIIPFFVTFDSRPLWRHVVDVVAVLMVYDFFYYFTHRFLFHGRLLRKVHALHHQVREPTHMDALYVHPLETSIGLVLYLGTIPLIALITGGPLNAFSMAIATLVFTQLNIINHTYVNLGEFPFRALSTITSLHAAHHVDMHHGNFATITMLYDWCFGTLESPVRRPSA